MIRRSWISGRIPQDGGPEIEVWVLLVLRGRLNWDERGLLAVEREGILTSWRLKILLFGNKLIGTVGLILAFGLLLMVRHVAIELLVCCQNDIKIIELAEEEVGIGGLRRRSTETGETFCWMLELLGLLSLIQ